VETVLIVLSSGVVVIGKPVSRIQGLGSVRGRGIELANARVFQGGKQVASAGSLQLEGGAIASIGSRGVLGGTRG
jgi:hypothetical protein